MRRKAEPRDSATYLSDWLRLGGRRGAWWAGLAVCVVTASPGGTTTTTPAYNTDGQTTSLASTSTGNSPPAGPPGLTSVTYNALGQVATAKTTAGTSSYTYDASGNVIGEDDPGQDTVFVDGGAEQLTENLPTGKTSGIRFITSPGGTLTAESSTGTISYEITSQQGTALEAVNAATDAITRRYYDPYGNPVGTVPGSWPDSNAFLGKPADPDTALDLLGARQYDPATGSFLSLDPVFEDGSPLQMGGYAYAAGNPIAGADPTGLTRCVETASGCVQPPSGNGGGGDGGGGGGYTGTGSGGGGGGSYPVGPIMLPASYRDFGRILALYDDVQTNEPGFAGAEQTPEEKFRALLDACESNRAVCGSVLMGALYHAGDTGTAGAGNGTNLETIRQDAPAQFQLNMEKIDTEVGAADATAASGDHIVLGLRDYGLEDTAAKVGGRTLLNDADWMSTLQREIGDSSTRFTVSTDGMSGSSTYGQIMSAAQRGAAGIGGYTDWEMAQLYAGDRLPDVYFVSGGLPIENPFG